MAAGMTAAEPAAAAGQAAERPAAYGAVAKWFHWVTVALMAVALPVGFVIKHVKDGDKMLFYAIHESAGLTLLVVAALRLAWRRFHPPPPLPASVPRVLRGTAAGVHHALYALLILQPLLGFFMTNAFGFPMRGQTAYLGLLDLPRFMEPVEWLANGLKALHRIGGWSILALLVLHVLGVVYHQAIRRDGTLLRMV
jgi:cytochrome b561